MKLPFANFGLSGPLLLSFSTWAIAQIPVRMWRNW